MNINELLIKAIYESNMPITTIAQRSGITRQHIYSIMNRKKNVSSSTLESICKAINISPSSLFNGVIEKTKSKGVKIPVLGSIPAGIPIEAIEDIVDYEEITENMAKSGTHFGLRVQGDSMQPTINAGDIVIIRQQEDAENGKICVVMVNGYDATLKAIKKEPNGLWVLPHNPNSDFKPTFYTNKEVEELPVRILGVAVEIRRSL